nr:FKBP-type peptidyl-prolyl cis-trans isomerase [Pedobacter sp. ASV19]
MLKNKILLVAVACAIILSSCSKDIPYDRKAQFTIDSGLIVNYVKDNKITDVKQKDGVFYKILREGTVDTTPVTLNVPLALFYTGHVLGTKQAFDSTGIQAPRVFVLANVIKGWQIGVPLIKGGGEIRLFIPSTLAYINRPVGPIPANSILDFDITLKEVNPKTQTN